MALFVFCLVIFIFTSIYIIYKKPKRPIRAIEFEVIGALTRITGQWKSQTIQNGFVYFLMIIRFTIIYIICKEQLKQISNHAHFCKEEAWHRLFGIHITTPATPFQKYWVRSSAATCPSGVLRPQGRSKGTRHQCSSCDRDRLDSQLWVPPDL